MTRTPRTGASRAAALAAAGLALAACQRDPVAHYRVPKVSGEVMASAAALPPPPAPAQGGLRWTLPAGWKEAQGGGQMRFATLTAPVPGKVDVSVVVLPGPAGGEAANVNRWRNQLGLKPMAEGELAGVRKPVKTAAGEVNVYDFTSDGEKKTRTVAGLTSAQGDTWFVKMTGDAEAVAAARPAFLEIIGSLRLEDR
jgi:hypothetical protein